jgi:hypothetical protein
MPSTLLFEQNTRNDRCADNRPVTQSQTPRRLILNRTNGSLKAEYYPGLASFAMRRSHAKVGKIAAARPWPDPGAQEGLRQET